MSKLIGGIRRGYYLIVIIVKVKQPGLRESCDVANEGLIKANLT